MRIIKSTSPEAGRIVPFPTRTAEPLLIDRMVEYNRRQLEERRVRRRAQAAWALVWVVCAVVSVWVGYLVSK